jgi:hypothetical protein
MIDKNILSKHHRRKLQPCGGSIHLDPTGGADLSRSRPSTGTSAVRRCCPRGSGLRSGPSSLSCSALWAPEDCCSKATGTGRIGRRSRSTWSQRCANGCAVWTPESPACSENSRFRRRPCCRRCFRMSLTTRMTQSLPGSLEVGGNSIDHAGAALSGADLVSA